MFEGNASYLYVANVARGTDTLAGMAAGSIAIINEAGTVQTSSIVTSNANYRVVQKLADGKFIFSPEFNPTKIKNQVGIDYEAPTQQTSYVGYNGSAGALDATADESFTMFLEWTNTAGFYNNRPLVLSATYHTTAASQEELSFGLLQNLDALMKRQPYKFVVVDRINNAAVTAANCLDNDATVVQGSTAFTIATALTYNSTAGTLAAGDFVRLHDPAASATYLYSPVYKVISAVDNGSTCAVVVDRPITCASGTYAAAADELEVIPSASIGANWGLKFVGAENSTFNAITETWSLTRFKILLNESFSTATVSYSTNASEGTGYWKQLANQEVYSQYLDKASFISAYPRNNIRQEVSSANTYDMITFEVEQQVYQSPTNGMAYGKSFKIQIATKESLEMDGVDTVLLNTAI